MFWTFIATVFCGLGAAGIALGIRAVFRKATPKWLIPVFAGAGMLGYLIYGEYTWFELKQSQLPEEAVIVNKRNARFTVMEDKTVLKNEEPVGLFNYAFRLGE